MPLSEKLSNTKFAHELVVTTKDIIADHMRIFLDTHQEFMEIGTKSEKYGKNTLYSFIDLKESIDTLELVPTFFAIKKVPRFYLRNGISETAYYKYHLENHYIKITSIIDFTSNFVNDVYRLGIPVRKCNVYAILENLNTKHTATGTVLKKFESHFQNIKKGRNIIIHEGKFDSEEIKSIDSTIISKEFLGKEKILHDWFMERKQREIGKVLQRINKDNTDVIDFLVEIIETLTEPFYNNYNFLKSLESVETSYRGSSERAKR